jgi:cytochrome c biogenesis protein CcmG, thiol:disulfide interchange protein DsbE
MVLILCGLLSACGTAGTGGQEAEPTSIQQGGRAAPVVGATAPDFSLTRLDGQGTVTLRQLLAGGKPLVLNAFASWCQPCKEETPDFVKLAKEYQGKVQFVGVNMTKAETDAGDVNKFASEFHISYPVLMDTDGTFMNAYQVFAFPKTLVVLPSGKVAAVFPGKVEAGQLKDALDKALHASS